MSTITGCPFPVAEHGSANFAGAAVIEIGVGDSSFAPTCVLNVPVGTAALRVTNNGTMKQSVTITDQGIDVDALPCETVDVDVAAGAATSAARLPVVGPARRRLSGPWGGSSLWSVVEESVEVVGDVFVGEGDRVGVVAQCGGRITMSEAGLGLE